MMQDFVEWGALGNILLWGVLVGAGLPAIFAVGVYVMYGPKARRKGAREIVLWRRIVGVTCFGVVVAAILVALAFIVSGGH